MINDDVHALADILDLLDKHGQAAIQLKVGAIDLRLAVKLSDDEKKQRAESAPPKIPSLQDYIARARAEQAASGA